MNSLDLVLKDCKAYIDGADLEKALNTIIAFSSSIYQDQRHYGRVFGSRDLDTLCSQIGSALLNKRTAEKGSVHSEAEDQVDILFLASNLYKSGGHTALIEDYLRVLSPRTCRILVSDHQNRADRASIEKRFAGLPADLRFSPRSASMLSKLNWLFDELLKANAQYCFFVHHPDDPLSVAAMQRSLCRRLAFIHHADHSFMLGLYANVDLHIDFRKNGAQNCRAIGLENNLILPLASADFGIPKSETRFLNSGNLLTCTSGNHKFEFPYSYQLTECIPAFLKATGGFHLHIGELSKAALLNLESEMQKNSIPANRLKIISWVENLWKTLIEEKVDFYIDSFPHPGCRALVEAMGAGLPVAVHQNYSNSLFSNKNFAYEGAFLWKDISELCNKLKEMDRSGLEAESKKARLYYLEEHHIDKLRTNLQSLLENWEPVDSPSTQAQHNFHPEHLRSFVDSFKTFNTLSNSARSERLSELIAIVNSLELPEELFLEKLEAELSLHSFKRFKAELAKCKRNNDLIDLLNKIYPIVLNDEVDKESLSRLLFACTLLKTQQEGTGSSRKDRVLEQVKNLYRLLKE